MNKFLALALVALSITACDKVGGGKTNSAAHGKFVQMCKDDPRAKEQGFDCTCQADIISAVLKNEEMDQLVNFLDVEKKDQSKAMELGKDPKFAPMFQKIAGVGLAIHDKCGDPSKAPKPAAAAAPAVSAPAAASAPAPAASKAPAAVKAKEDDNLPE